MKKQKSAPMAFFTDHDDQEVKDLSYGEQHALCEALNKKSEGTISYQDPSITGTWTPDED